MADTDAAPGAANPLPVAATATNRVATNIGLADGAVTTSGTTMTIVQRDATAIKNWDSFNVGSNHTVRFVQPDSNSRILNRIWDASPSQINGRVVANGQVYLVNRNGRLFGPHSQIDVGGLVASALNIKPDVFEKGFLSVAGKDAAFYYAGAMVQDAAGQWVVTDFDTPANSVSVFAAEGKTTTSAIPAQDSIPSCSVPAIGISPGADSPDSSG